MELKKITLLSQAEYVMRESIIPKVPWWWWLKTPHLEFDNCVHVVFDDALDYNTCDFEHGGVRPLCVFALSFADAVYWHKSDKIIGSKIKFGKYKWTILSVNNDTMCALCDDVITNHRFDENTNVWEISELKQWLETEGLNLINA
jgi:hypothetical protein